MIISVKAIAGAKTEEVLLLGFDELNRQIFKVKVRQAAADGQANQAIITILSGYFKVKKNTVRIINGELSRNKIIAIDVK
jgi:uncharacterized protein (TIGR00251 family)